MQVVKITKNEAGQRLDKLLAKYLNLAGKSFIYKMLRKKNITLNGKKCDGSEKLSEGDEVKLFLSDETIEKFSEVKIQKVRKRKLDVVYEDDDIILINKPSGMLSQKAKETDESLVEYLIQYLLDGGKLTKEDMRQFKPSVCNRLDRNTSGIVIGRKSLPGLQLMSEAIKERTIGKYYLCIVKGSVAGPKEIDGYLKKNEKTNQVTVLKANELSREDKDSASHPHTVPAALQRRPPYAFGSKTDYRTFPPDKGASGLYRPSDSPVITSMAIRLSTVKRGISTQSNPRCCMHGGL